MADLFDGGVVLDDLLDELQQLVDGEPEIDVQEHGLADVVLVVLLEEVDLLVDFILDKDAGHDKGGGEYLFWRSSGS